jgi:hypothetical protein
VATSALGLWQALIAIAGLIRSRLLRLCHYPRQVLGYAAVQVNSKYSWLRAPFRNQHNDRLDT